MNRAAELQYEHDVLRGQLASVDIWASALPDSRHILATVVRALTSRFQHHAEREEATLLDLQRLQLGHLPALADDWPARHAEYRHRLASLQTLLSVQHELADRVAGAQARDLTRELRDQLAEEEAQLFPLFDRYLPAALPGCGDPRPEQSAPGWSFYRRAVGQRLQTLCFARLKTPGTPRCRGIECPLDAFLPELVELVSRLGRCDLQIYEVAITAELCPRCPSLDSAGGCTARALGECCLFRCLPELVETIERIRSARGGHDARRGEVGIGADGGDAPHHDPGDRGRRDLDLPGAVRRGDPARAHADA